MKIVLIFNFEFEIRDQIPNLYYMSNRDYETTFIRIARDVILQSAGKYEAPTYWVNKQDYFS